MTSQSALFPPILRFGGERGNALASSETRSLRKTGIGEEKPIGVCRRQQCGGTDLTFRVETSPATRMSADTMKEIVNGGSAHRRGREAGVQHMFLSIIPGIGCIKGLALSTVLGPSSFASPTAYDCPIYALGLHTPTWSGRHGGPRWSLSAIGGSRIC